MASSLWTRQWITIALCAFLAACGGGGGGGSDSINSIQSVNTANNNLAGLSAGDTRQLTASVVFDDGSERDVSANVVWSTPEDDGPASARIVEINDNGLLSALRAGTTTLTATIDGVSSQPISITIAEPRLESITVTATGLQDNTDPGDVFELTTGVSFTASGRFSDNQTRTLTNARFSSSLATALSFANATSGSATINAVTANRAVVVTASQDNISGTFNVTVLNNAVTSVQIRRDDGSANGAAITGTTNLQSGATFQLLALSTLTSGATRDDSANATWGPTNNGSISVDSDGTVTAALRSTTAVSVTAEVESVTASNSPAFTVSATLVSVSVSPSSADVPAGLTQQYTVFGTFSDGAPAEQLGDDSGETVTWALADVSPAGAASINSSGLATAITQGGTADIIATATVAGTTKTSSGNDNGTITVVAPIVTSIAVSAPASAGSNANTGNPTLPANSDDQYVATATFSNNTNGDVTDQVEWTSSDNNTAVVDNASNKGLVSGIAVGTAAITATFTNPDGSSPATPSGSINVEITEADPVSITIGIVRGDNLTRVARGFDLQFEATGRFPDGTTDDITDQVTWFTSVDSSIATIDSNGLLTAASGIELGTIENVSVQAQVSSNNVGDSTNITVEGVSLFEIVVEPADSQLPIGEQLQYTATGNFTTDDLTIPSVTPPTTAFSMDLGDQVTWSSSSATEATIDQTGMATGVAAGMVQIQADCSAMATPQAECNDPRTVPAGQRISGTTGLTVTDVVVRDLFLSTITTANGAVCQQPTPADANANDEPQCFANVAKGLNIQLRARAVFSDGTVNDNYQTSPNITFAAVDANGNPCSNVTVSNAAGSRGRVTGSQLGNCLITATASNESTAADDAETADRLVQITVTDEVLQRICVEPANATPANNCMNGASVSTSAPAGVGIQYRARGTFSDGSRRLLTSADQIAWFATPASGVVDVKPSGIVTGLTEGIGMTAQIQATAQSANGSVITSGASNFDVNAATLASVEVTPETITLPASTGGQLSATATFSDGTTADVTANSSTTWSSDDSSAVTVSNASGAQGRIFASGSAGNTAMVTATFTFGMEDPQSASSSVTVAEGLVTAITVTPADASVTVGGSQQYVATAQRSDGSSDDISDQVEWSIVATGDGGAASITAAGNATGDAEGTVRVFARFNRGDTNNNGDDEIVSGNTVLTVAAPNG